MKIVGIIAEYNPFHKGHEFHIEKAKKITGADAAIIIMSGDYVQRGIPSIMPKHLRTQMALACGADVVLELPVCYATGSAEYFATGAVSLLEALGCVDYLCFGSECGEIKILQQIADVLCKETDLQSSPSETFKKWKCISCRKKTGFYRIFRQKQIIVLYPRTDQRDSGFAK